MAGLVIAAFCVAFSPPLRAAIEVETFTDYNAFLSLLGQSAQVVNFDDVPTADGFGLFDSNRYATQGIVISASGGDGYRQVAWSLPDFAVSPPNVYSAGLEAPGLPPTFREFTDLSFTRDGEPALTSAFGAFFINNPPTEPEDNLHGFLGASGADGSLLAAGRAPRTARNGSSFLGFAAVDSEKGQLVPAIGQVEVNAGLHNVIDVYLDNFTFAAPVAVPEANAWALLAGTALAAVGLYGRRARLTA